MSEHSEASNYTWLKYLCDLDLGRELAVTNSSGFVGVAVLFCMKQHKSSRERFAKFRKLDPQPRGIKRVLSALNRSASANKIKTLKNAPQDEVQDRVVVSGISKIGEMLAAIGAQTFSLPFIASTESSFTRCPNAVYPTHARVLAIYVPLGNTGDGMAWENGKGRLGIEDIAGINLEGRREL